jgi:8-oxo-dGTP diphosphatase
MTEPKITIGTVCFITDQATEKFLMLKRAFEPMKDLWTGVGGKTGYGEDIRQSCIREVYEETGLYIKNPKLKGVVKTILQGKDSSWILFVYTADEYQGNLSDCPEGELQWVNKGDVMNLVLPGFIREIFPFTKNHGFFEGTMVHDKNGVVIEKVLNLNQEHENRN